MKDPLKAEHFHVINAAKVTQIEDHLSDTCSSILASSVIIVRSAGKASMLETIMKNI